MSRKSHLLLDVPNWTEGANENDPAGQNHDFKLVNVWVNDVEVQGVQSVKLALAGQRIMLQPSTCQPGSVLTERFDLANDASQADAAENPAPPPAEHVKLAKQVGEDLHRTREDAIEHQEPPPSLEASKVCFHLVAEMLSPIVAARDVRVGVFSRDDGGVHFILHNFADRRRLTFAIASTGAIQSVISSDADGSYSTSRTVLGDREALLRLARWVSAAG